MFLFGRESCIKKSYSSICINLIREIKIKTKNSIGFALDEASAAEKITKYFFYSWIGKRKYCFQFF
jgi:hypothetical protein